MSVLVIEAGLLHGSVPEIDVPGESKSPSLNARIRVLNGHFQASWVAQLETRSMTGRSELFRKSTPIIEVFLSHEARALEGAQL